MSSLNDIVIQLQILGEQAPEGYTPVQTAMYLAISFGRPAPDVCDDKELRNCSVFLDHANFIRLLRRLLPLDGKGTRSHYTGLVPKYDMSSLLQVFGRDPSEVEHYMSIHVPEDQIGIAQFLRILGKPIAGQRYPAGVYAASRPLAGASSRSSATNRVNRRMCSKTAAVMPLPRDAVAMALTRRNKYLKYRAAILRQRARRGSDATDSSSECGGLDRELGALSSKLRGLRL